MEDDPFLWSSEVVREQLCTAESDLRSKIQVKSILNVKNLENALRDNDIDGENLLILDDINVKEDLGIASFGQRREIRKIILHLRENSVLYQVDRKKNQKRHLDSHNEEPDTTPESKRRKLQSQDLLVTPITQIVDTSIQNPEPFPSHNLPAHPSEPARRRVQPENLSAEPVSVPTNSLSHAHLEASGRLTTALVSGPEDFDPATLSDEWQDFLDRYREESDESVLRPYNETDSEKELNSEDDASLMAELQSDNELTTPQLSSKDIEEAIDQTLDEFKKAWNLHKRPKKQRAAYRRWMQAAKAQTRKPQQNILQRELDALRRRLAKFRRSIEDASMDYHKIGEVKRNCLNLQATVEDIAEREYYLETLASNHPPITVHQDLKLPIPEEKLSDGEELLESSDSATQEESEPSDSISDMSLASGEEQSLALSYDPSDTEWNPILPRDASPGRAQPVVQSPTGVNGSTISIDHVEVTDLTLPVLYGELSGTPLQSVDQTGSLTILTSPSLPHKIDTPSLTPYRQIPKPDDESENDSDLDRLPKNRYVNKGNTWDTAIALGSSPSRHSDNPVSHSDSSIRTPPLNPTLVAHMKQEIPKPFTFPPIRDLRTKKWTDVNGDADLALCKIVYRTNRALVKDVQQFIELLTPAKVIIKLRTALESIQDTDVSEVPVDVDPNPDILLSHFFLVYAHRRGFKDVWSVAPMTLANGLNMLSNKGIQFDQRLRPLLKHYIETGTSTANQISLSTSTNGQSLANDRTDLSQSVGIPASKQHAGSKRLNTPPPRNTFSDTETDLDDQPSSLKKRKRRVEQSQQALSQQRDDQNRVQEQEKRRQIMMDKFHSQEAAGEDHHVIVNSVEDVPVLLDQHIARRIKPHQETGVQFIWRELVEDKKQQGCLLAHTMGLGKTMQVISFLVTLAQCNASARPEVRALVPKKLRSGRVLILCPASLVENWYDELMIWTPPNSLPGSERDVLGRVYKSSGSRNIKIQTVRNWQRRAPAVLIIGYESLRSLLTGKSVPDEDKKYLENALLQDPCIVVGDEAHKMKNAKSSISKLAQTFRTNSRIALTGSPLNNHLEEYHTMIDWIAPGYLGSLVQFKAKYSETIERGLFAESTPFEKRKSLERLYVLKRDLAPKIDRRDISAIAADMPQKIEFFITVPLTKLQNDLYRLLIKQILQGLNSSSTPRKSSNTQLWSWLSILSWLCNHPTILTQKLEGQDKNNVQDGVDNEDFDDDGAPANVDMDKYPIASLLPEFLQCYAKYEDAVDRFNPQLSTRALVTQRLIEESVNNGERILLFSHSIPTLNYLQGMLDELHIKHMRIDGSTRTDQRQAATKEFNDDNNDYMVFLISTRAGGLGLNLQGANRVIIYDFGFNPSWEEQAIGRAYRLGQKKPVFVYRFRAGGSFEDKMYNTSIFKTQLFSRVVDQKNVIRRTTREIKDYLFEPKEAEQKDLTECLGKDELLDRVVAQVPGAIRGLLLTETFQREDEDDVLTAEQKRAADAEVEMERLLRTDPEAARAKRAAIDKAAAMQRTPYPSTFHDSSNITGDVVRGWFANPALDLDNVPVRDAARANAEKMDIFPVSGEIADAKKTISEDSNEQLQASGCESQ